MLPYGGDTSTTSTSVSTYNRPSSSTPRLPNNNNFLSPFYSQPHSTAERHPLDSSSSSAVNYIPMNEASFDYTAEQFELRVHPPKQYRCCCGQIHVVLGTKLFLVLYVVLTMFGLVFGMVQAMVWTGIPFLVTVMTVYGFCRKKHKYLYPFLIISVVQLIVCLIMGLVIATFSIMNFETLKMILAHNMKSEPSTTVIVAIVGGTVLSCFLLAIIHVWQVMVIYSCLQYYEYDLRPDRALVSTHGDPTNNGFSYFESTQKLPHNIDALASLNSEMQQRGSELMA
ncbi:unnamed protein product [Bursaphelenchus xylophilus]|uniref:(pine wood nematode) hypothetical protein n=1 Tax=Bursaphelenchus xylophilus TaxID=6326 RepID=A0A1I7RHP4_BURXY|nr:unnamed protein product [Bursaphelenchus xylophilus]CAG9115526.1 unnamed protein product [Bursaphelenchus xylophilus]